MSGSGIQGTFGHTNNSSFSSITIEEPVISGERVILDLILVPEDREKFLSNEYSINVTIIHNSVEIVNIVIPKTHESSYINYYNDNLTIESGELQSSKLEITIGVVADNLPADFEFDVSGNIRSYVIKESVFKKNIFLYEFGLSNRSLRRHLGLEKYSTELKNKEQFLFETLCTNKCFMMKHENYAFIFTFNHLIIYNNPILQKVMYSKLARESKYNDFDLQLLLNDVQVINFKNTRKFFKHYGICYALELCQYQNGIGKMSYTEEGFGGWSDIDDNILSYDYPFNEALGYNSKHKYSTLQDGRTTNMIMFLHRTYQVYPLNILKDSIVAGIEFILNTQHESGSWSLYSYKTGEYHDNLSINDGVHVNALSLLYEILRLECKLKCQELKDREERAFNFCYLGQPMLIKIEQAYLKGIQFLLNTQIEVDGIKTLWAQQYNPDTLEPTNGRSYELAAICGLESVGVVRLLQRILKKKWLTCLNNVEYDNLKPEMELAVQSAISWYETHVLEKNYYKYDKKFYIGTKLHKPQWARYYHLETQKPIFLDRDSTIYYELTEMNDVDSSKNTSGYSWYTNLPNVFFT